MCIYRDGELIAIVKKNGKNLLYSVKEMSFGEITDLFEAQMPNN